MIIWRRLNLRGRILAACGLVLAVTAGLGLLFVSRVSDLNEQIAGLNQSVAADAAAGARLAESVASTQLAADRFLQDARPENRALADAALARLEADIAAAEVSAAGRADLGALSPAHERYHESYQRLSALIERKETQRERLTLLVFQASALSGNALADVFITRQGGARTVTDLTEAQNALDGANLRISRMLSEGDTEQGALAAAELEKVRALLERTAARGSASTALQEALKTSSEAISATGELAQNLANQRVLRDEELAPRADALRAAAGQVARDALGALTAATADLERQLSETKRLSGLVLAGMVVMVVLAGLQLAGHLVRPLTSLAAAVERVNDGDYTTSVPTADGAEIGRLASAFNQMTATLHAQREQVRSQQRAAEQRAAELELALQDLQSAQQAQAELAASVRAMSVPVVPILRSVIVVPLVGEIDAARADVLMQRVLAGVTDERARIVILDITGVPFVDGALAALLLQAAQAVELLGARCLLVGISPEVAQALVASGADLGRLRTYADLRAGVAFALAAAGGRA